MKQVEEEVPLLASFYLRLYHATPKIYIPGTKVDIGFMFCWAAFFTAMRAIVVVGFLRYGWPAEPVFTYDSAASVVGGLFHATNIVPMSYLLMRTENPWCPAAAGKDHPQWWRDAVDAMLQLCTGYMIYDFFFLVWTRYVPGEGVVLGADALLFMGHHFVTSFYMTSTRIYDAGHSSALMCIFLGEFTNPPFNAWCILNEARKHWGSLTPWLEDASVVNEIVLAATYVPIRGIISPIACIYMTYELFTKQSARTCVPVAIRVTWSIMMAAVVLGSISHNNMFYDALMKHAGLRTAEGGEEL
jgi:hypothetical protein